MIDHSQIKELEYNEITNGIYWKNSRLTRRSGLIYMHEYRLRATMRQNQTS